MKRFSHVMLMLVLFLVPALAQQTSSSDAPATREDIEKLFTAMHIREQMSSMMQIMAKQQKQMVQETLKKKMPDIRQKDLDRIEAMMDQTMKDIDVNGMIDDMIPVYERHLSKTDVAAMSAFYQTPTGQKVLREQPQMTAEAMQAMQPRMEKMMASIMDQAQKMAKEAQAEKQDTSEKN